MGKHGKKAADATKPKKKRGNVTDFKGARLEYLQDALPVYIQAAKENKKKGKKGKEEGTRAFWTIFFHGYWRTFPWRLPFDEDPPPAQPWIPGDPNNPTMASCEEAFRALDLDLTEEEETRKAAIMKDINGKIKRWFSRQRPTAIGIQGNPFFEYLAELRRNGSVMAPRRQSDAQFYLAHPDFKDAIAERFQEEHGDAQKGQALSLRCKLARRMLFEESEEVQLRIKRECDEAHAEDVAEYNASQEGLPSVDPEVQQLYISFFESESRGNN
ncbi:hypothetical protein C8F04DRAFT_1264286 [Mycena alexandri]|uniref:Uncharacterized protein n=1 Tax=Mycena alexandri TaxID=1745969 RepID=A0AAD6SL20_9AGAR|nr:hypothetical protein C8F04DRAFT_1264286 [Mycena alexandri]